MLLFWEWDEGWIWVESFEVFWVGVVYVGRGFDNWESENEEDSEGKWEGGK